MRQECASAHRGIATSSTSFAFPLLGRLDQFDERSLADLDEHRCFEREVEVDGLDSLVVDLDAALLDEALRVAALHTRPEACNRLTIQMRPL